MQWKLTEELVKFIWRWYLLANKERSPVIHRNFDLYNRDSFRKLNAFTLRSHLIRQVTEVLSLTLPSCRSRTRVLQLPTTGQRMPKLRPQFGPENSLRKHRRGPQDILSQEGHQK